MMNTRWATCVTVSVGLLAAAAVRGGEVKPPADFPTEPPVGKLLRPATLPKPHSTKLGNGMEVVVITNDEIPWVSVGWYLLTGAKNDPGGKAGVAEATAALLRQGTAKHSPDELAELLDYHAISLSGSAGHQTSSVYVGTLTKTLDLALETLAEVVRTPIFDADEYRRHIEATLSGLAIQEKDGSYLAGREFARRIYGDHFRAHPAEGTSKTVANIKRQDLVAFHQRHYMPNNSLLIFSGAVESKRAVELARKHFDDWKPGQVAPVETGEIPEPSETRIFLVDRPDATQTQLRIGQIGYRRTDPEYIPGQVFNQVFGGSFSSRLNKRIRVKEGLTYGARGGYSAGREPGRLLVSTFTRNDETAKTLGFLLEEINRMRDEAPDAEEMSDAQSYIVGRFGLSMETPRDVAGKVFDLKFYGLPDDYYANYLDKVTKLQADEILGFSKKMIDPGRLVIVLVGNAADFEKDLEGIAPVTKISSDEVLAVN